LWFCEKTILCCFHFDFVGGRVNLLCITDSLCVYVYVGPRSGGANGTDIAAP